MVLWTQLWREKSDIMDYVMEREVRFYGLSYGERSLILWTMLWREKSGFMDSVMEREV